MLIVISSWEKAISLINRIRLPRAIQVFLLPVYRHSGMSRHHITTLRHQPVRVCKKVARKPSRSAPESDTTHLAEDTDSKSHGKQVFLTSTYQQTCHQQETSRRWSDTLASLAPHCPNNFIHIFDSRDPAHLFKAIRWGEIRSVREWYKNNAMDFVPKDSTGRTVLHLGAEKGELGLFNFLFQHSGVDINAIDTSGKTALSYAAQYERAALVQRLLCSYGASVDVRDNSGRTPLSLAAGSNSYRSIELLLEAGADVVSEDNSGRTPLFHAVRAGNCAATVRFVRHAKNGNQALVLAAQMGEGKVENKLITLSKNVAHWENRILRKLLLKSAHDGRDDMVRMLLHLHDVDSNTQDCDGRTPLSLAAERGHHNIIRILSRYGANRDLKDKKSRSPLDYASRQSTSTYRCILRSRIQRRHDSNCLLRNLKCEHQRSRARNNREARRVQRS